MKDNEFEFVQIHRIGIGSESHSMFSVSFRGNHKEYTTWVLISGQNGGIQVGNICTMDKSESELAPVLRYAWDYMIEMQKV